MLSEEGRLGNLGKKTYILMSNFVELLCVCKIDLRVTKELSYLYLSTTGMKQVLSKVKKNPDGNRRVNKK